MNGWAIECRINAEDPFNNFLPSTGFLDQITPPTGPGVRVDSGVYPGVEISPYYDSLISKLICWGETRHDAILRMRQALEEYRILGLQTNIPFHQKIMQSHHFISGQFDTRFVEERFSMEEAEDGAESLPHIAAIMATLVAHHQTHPITKIRRPDNRQPRGWKWVGRMERLGEL